jgi:hypothetical protein
MKKFIISLFILLLLGGFVFFWGWISFYLPPNSYAVLHTKTSGFDPHVVAAGTFVWKIENLLPTNMTVYPFKLDTVTLELPPVTGELPSGPVYASILDGDFTFEFELGMTIQMMIKPESLPLLVADEGLRPEGLEDWYKQKGELILQYAKSYVLQHPLNFFAGYNEEQFVSEISQESTFAAIKLQHILLKKLKAPDMDLYQETKRRYLELSQAKEKIDLASLSREKNNIATLHKYGELFSKYPILLKYLYLKELDGEKLDIFDLSLFGEPKVSPAKEAAKQ